MTKLVDKPEIITSDNKDDTNEPVTVELPPEDGEQEIPDGGGGAPVETKRPDAGDLRQQIADLNAAEQQRQQQAAAQYYQQQQLAQQRREYEQTQYDNMVLTLNDYQNQEQQAQNDLAASWHRGDYQGAAEAQTRIARVQAQKLEIERAVDNWQQQEQPPPLPQQPQQQQYQQPAPPSQRSSVDIINSMTALIPEERAWLLKRPELVSDPQRAQELQTTYMQARRAGLVRGTPEYFAFFEDRLGGGGRNKGAAGANQTNAARLGASACVAWNRQSIDRP